MLVAWVCGFVGCLPAWVFLGLSLFGGFLYLGFVDLVFAGYGLSGCCGVFFGLWICGGL